MKTRLILIAASLAVSPVAGAFAQNNPIAAAPAQPNAQQFQAGAGGRAAAVGAQRGQTLAQNFQTGPGGAAGFGGRGQGGARGSVQQGQGDAQNQGFAANGGRGGPPGGRGGPGGPGGAAGPGGRGPGGRGPVVNATPLDPISEAFRNEASAVSGSGAEASILMVTNYGWMRSTRTLKIGTEFQDGWMLKEVDASKAVLNKPDNPDKVIDLSRWTGETGSGYNTNATLNANGPATISFSSVGTVRSSQAARPIQPAPTPTRSPQPVTPGRGPVNTGRAATPPGRAPSAAAGATVTIQGQAQRGR